MDRHPIRFGPWPGAGGFPVPGFHERRRLGKLPLPATLPLPAFVLALPALVLVTLGSVLVLTAGVAGADTVSLTAVADNTLFQNNEGTVSSGSGEGLFVGNNRQSNTRRAVLRFDLTVIPSGSTIDSVELRLTVSSAGENPAATVTVHRLLASWGEGASASSGGAGDSSEVGDATWIHRFYPDTLWTTPGGDFDPVVLASSPVPGVGGFAWSGPDLTTAVQNWLDEPPSNDGLLLKGSEAAASTVRLIHSREHPEALTHPTLVVSFSSPPNPVEKVTWGRLKARGPGSWRAGNSADPGPPRP